MCLIVYGHERFKYSKLFAELFRLRYEVFVRDMKWSLPSRHGQEVDQYDNDDAVYFITKKDDGSIEASMRMTPTMHSSLLADYFPHLIETGDAPRSPHIYEATRYIVRPDGRSTKALRAAKGRLFLPIIEWCLEKRLTHFQCVIDARALNFYVEISPQTRPLGLAHPFGGGPGVPGGGECIAIRWPINMRGLEEARAFVAAEKRSRAGQNEFAIH